MSEHDALHWCLRDWLTQGSFQMCWYIVVFVMLVVKLLVVELGCRIVKTKIPSSEVYRKTVLNVFLHFNFSSKDASTKCQPLLWNYSSMIEFRE